MRTYRTRPNAASSTRRTVRRARRAAIVVGVVAAATALGATIASAQPVKPSTPKAGGACTVTSGPNKGKTGTYTTEEGTGSTWCEGSWGGTECGPGKCKSALVFDPRGVDVAQLGEVLFTAG
jgi:hypothetical protein